MRIKSISDFRRAYRHGPYAWPGGYPCHFVCDDGEPLCFACAKDFRREILEAIADKNPPRKDWLTVALAINWEDAALYCSNCATPIASAYGEG